MKHLYEYILEKKNKKTSKKELYNILMSLAEKDTLGDYVEQLNDMLEDNDAKQILVKAFGEAKRGYKFKGNWTNIPVVELHPTQSEIDVDKSLGFPFKHGEDVAKKNGDRYYGSAPVSMPFPLITFNGKFILDGHHRWSQVFAFNKDAKMECLDIKLSPDSNIKELTPNDALKICQGVLAAKRARDHKGKIPQAKVEGANIFKMKEEDIKNKVKKYIEQYEDAANILAECAKLKSVNDFVKLLSNNLLTLQNKNKQYSEIGNPRGDMPQTDRGGNDPDDMKTAMPSKKGSALNLLLKGTISDKTLNK